MEALVISPSLLLKKKAFKLSLLTGPTHGVYVLNVPWQAIRDVHKFYILVELLL